MAADHAASDPVVVVGGGWAGLAAAVELAYRNIPVLVLESSRQLGGRARRVPFGKDGVDNGQHLLIGAYRETLRLMTRVGVSADTCLRQPLHLLVDGGDERLALTAPPVPAPLHLAFGLLFARGLSVFERLRALAFAVTLQAKRFELRQDMSVSELIAAQPSRLVRLLWEPLCLAALNTRPEHASAQVFLRVLRDTFAFHRKDSDLLIPRVDLGRAFPEPAMDYIERRGGSVRLNRRVTALEVRKNRVTGVCLDNERIPASHVILAAPAPAAARLLAPYATTQSLAAALASLSHEPIATVYLRYAPEHRLAAEMVGMVGTLTQWLFDRRVYGQPGLMAAVISGPGVHMEMERDALAQVVAAEISTRFNWPAPRETLVVREKRATFHCGVDVDALRPSASTPLAGCWLAGDYTATGYPATLEGAVRSGVECARLITSQGIAP